MASTAVSRIKSELEELLHSEEIERCPIKIERVNGSWTDLRGEISGPPNTPYEGGKYTLEIKVPEEYPDSPPKVRFMTLIWHPNVSFVTGTICPDILEDKWAAAMTLRTAMLSLQALLAAAQPDPRSSLVAYQFRNQHDLFLRTAKHWTHAYAGGPHTFPEFDSKIQLLVEKGFAEDDARSVLSSENWNLDKATECLVS
ncbi:ubiquitin-conjugating enzyme E2-22 kDa-like [Drosophila miranda]|uniref:ubiquitin-conjugating enzyme E2-22 kDa-like n=1 Tax=Drosophila miranda TaxID=7229 RepID=UPI0007E8858D|nr:ubiquitin-conjugating enzyme E2-22 kDa-like [Drosophila miranda]